MTVVHSAQNLVGKFPTQSPHRTIKFLLIKKEQESSTPTQLSTHLNTTKSLTTTTKVNEVKHPNLLHCFLQWLLKASTQQWALRTVRNKRMKPKPLRLINFFRYSSNCLMWTCMRSRCWLCWIKSVFQSSRVWLNNWEFLNGIFGVCGSQMKARCATTSSSMSVNPPQKVNTHWMKGRFLARWVEEACTQLVYGFPCAKPEGTSDAKMEQLLAKFMQLS